MEVKCHEMDVKHCKILGKMPWSWALGSSGNG